MFFDTEWELGPPRPSAKGGKGKPASSAEQTDPPADEPAAAPPAPSAVAAKAPPAAPNASPAPKATASPAHKAAQALMAAPPPRPVPPRLMPPSAMPSLEGPAAAKPNKKKRLALKRKAEAAGFNAFDENGALAADDGRSAQRTEDGKQSKREPKPGVPIGLAPKPDLRGTARRDKSAKPAADPTTNPTTNPAANPAPPPAAAPAPPPPAKGQPLSAIQKKLQSKLQGARFRQLNEQLYTTNSSSAFKMLKSEPELFKAYHQGFREQVRRWPQNPLDGLVQWANKLPTSHVLGDFGCGEAQLAASVPQTVHSFDLVAPNERVTACDICKVPLPDGALDGAVFCLALMGVNWPDFLREAHRTLKVGGVLKIVEVKSRVTDLADFLRTLRALGFETGRKAVNESNTHFVAVEAVKAARAPEKQVEPKPLAPCIYKRR
ncbi:methyltransferase-domain-containing protein [Pavlovales sp. CCMP2436]|nr:methyltransferase-domain-containing protein [Pavlovales sp. CCMP2436]